MLLVELDQPHTQKKIKDWVLSEEKQHMSDIYCERKCHRKSLLGCVAFDSIIMV